MGNSTSKRKTKQQTTIEELYSCPFDLEQVFDHSKKVRDINVTYKPRPKSSVNFARCYEVKNRRKSYVLIVNNTTGESRKGADLDVKNVRSLLKKFNFSTTIKNNLSLPELIKCVESFAKNPKFSDCNMCMVMMLGIAVSTSDQKICAIECADKKCMPIIDIVERFGDNKCPSLAEKPKFFLFQGSDTGLRSEDFDETSPRWLNMRDVFVSSVLLTSNQENTRTFSSYFVQAFCQNIMNEAWHKDLEELYKKVETAVYNFDQTAQHTYYMNNNFKKYYMLDN